MNFGDIQGMIQRHIGHPTASLIEDQVRQEIRDAVNAAMDESMAEMEPYFWWHVRESTISASSATEIYTLNDRCLAPLNFWTEDPRARQIPFIDPREMDRNGNKNDNASQAYADSITWYEPTTSAAKSGAAGETAGISITSGSTAVTKSGGTAFESTDVGKLLRINNEMDIPISEYTSANAITLERAYVGRIAGTDQDNSPSSLSQVAWQISPPGRYRIRIPPAPSESETIYYRYAQAHAPLLNDTDIPDLPGKYHMVLVWGGLANVSLYRNDQAAHEIYFGRYQRLLDRMKRENDDALGSRTKIPYSSTFNQVRLYRPEDADWGRRLGRRGW